MSASWLFADALHDGVKVGPSNWVGVATVAAGAVLCAVAALRRRRVPVRKRH